MSEHEFPYPFPGGPPRFQNKHATQMCREEYERRAVIKRCAHVRLVEVGGDPFERPDWGLDCEQDSFVVVPDPNAPPYALAEDVFLGCPPNCRFYVPISRVHRQERTAAVGRGLSVVVKAPFGVVRWLLTWFAGLPATTQALLVLGALLVFGILTWPQVVEMFDKVRAK
jgi:hypothetical protein